MAAGNDSRSSAGAVEAAEAKGGSPTSATIETPALTPSTPLPGTGPIRACTSICRIHCRRWWHCHRWGCHRCGW